MILNSLNTLSHDKAIRIAHALYKTLRMARMGEIYDFMHDSNLNQDDRRFMQQISTRINLSSGNSERIDDALKELDLITDKLMKESGGDAKRGRQLLAGWNS